MVFFGEDRRPSIRPFVRPSVRTTNGYAGAHEDSGSDSSPERRDDSGADTGLEAPMWQLGLGGGGGESGPAYPERPGVADCLHYLRTGYCGYGAMCRFNHPRHRSTVVGATRTGGAEYPQRAGQPTHRLAFLERRMLFVRPPVRTMNGYPGAQEGSRSNPLPEWPNDPRAETGLEEPMWQLGSGSGSSGEGEPDLAHPERPGEAYCIYYLRTGYCWYGAMCRFNHPRLQNTVVGARRAGGAEYPERAGQRICLYYMKTGRCKFGAACRYHHPRHGAGPSEYSLPTRSSSTASMLVTSVGSARASSGPAPSQMPDLSSTNPASRNTEERHSPG